jgi:hypothetical protein
MTKTKTNVWVCGAIWLLLIGAGAALYVTGFMSTGTLVLLEACLVALGAIVLVFWAKTTSPAESIDEVLYGAEHPKERS